MPWTPPGEVIDRGEGPDGAFVTGRYHLSQTARRRHPPMARRGAPPDPIRPERPFPDPRPRRSSTSPTRNCPSAWASTPTSACPFGPGGDLDRTSLIVPASQYWVLDESIPTGEVRPVDDDLDFRQGKSMAGLKVDAVLTGLEPNAEGFVACRLIDETLDAEFRLGFEAAHFREVVLFTPPLRRRHHRRRALTPRPPTAINLRDRGIDAGLRVLRPGRAGEHADRPGDGGPFERRSSRTHRHHSAITSPLSRVQSACHVRKAISEPNQRTEPSAIAAFTPPGVVAPRGEGAVTVDGDGAAVGNPAIGGRPAREAGVHPAVEDPVVPGIELRGLRPGSARRSGPASRRRRSAGGRQTR